MPSLLGLQPQTLLQSVLDSVGVALAVINREGKFVFTNRAALNMFGATEELNGVSLQEWRRGYVFHDSQGRDIPAEQAPVLRALAGEEVKPQEAGVTFPDGRTKWLHVAAHSFSVLGLEGVFVVVTDETDQVELRRALERSGRIEAVGLLAGALAHDFNNMLSVIAENVALALQDKGVPESTRVRLQQMGVALERGSALATRLVGYSRAQKIRTRSIQINDAVNTALELTRPLLKSRVHVKVELGCDLPMAEADPSRIEQVIVNLILNALDAMPDGGELTLRTELAEWHLPEDEDKRPRKFILITVSDTGIGIPRNLQARIFDPCFTTKAEGKGAGLGLSSAYEIVRQHRGSIQVQSRPGAGTKFSIYLPAEEGSWAKEKSG